MRSILKNRLLDRFIALVVFVNILFITLSSFSGVISVNSYSAYAIVSASTIIFVIEYVVRILNANKKYPTLSKYKSRIKYITSFYGLVDLISIIPFFAHFLVDNTSRYEDLIILARVVLLFKLLRNSATLRFMLDVFKSVKAELFMSWGFALIVIIISGYLMYFVESQAQPEVFHNVGQGVWWSIITFATVGYGDIYPITALGKILASFIALIGVAMIAIPSGIISSAFIKRMDDIKKEKENYSYDHNHIHGQSHGQSKTSYCPHCGKKLN